MKRNNTNNTMNAIRKTAAKQLLLIVLPILPFVYLISNGSVNQPFFLKLILSAGVIIAIWNFALFMVSLEELIDDIFPPKIKYEIVVSTFDNAAYKIAAIMFPIGLFLLAFQIQKIDNTINGIKLFWKYGMPGLIISVIILIALNKISKTIYAESNRRITIILSLALGFFLLFPAIASIINRGIADKKEVCSNYYIDRKSLSNGKHVEYFIFCTIENSKERLSISEDEWKTLEEGQTVELCIRKGYLGYDFITKVSGNNNNW